MFKLCSSFSRILFILLNFCVLNRYLYLSNLGNINRLVDSYSFIFICVVVVPFEPVVRRCAFFNHVFVRRGNNEGRRKSKKAPKISEKKLRQKRKVDSDYVIVDDEG